MKKHYHAFNTEGPDTTTRGRWKIEGPGLRPALFFDDRTTAAVVVRALEQALEAGRGRTRDTLEPIGRLATKSEDERTDPDAGTARTITEIKR